MDQKASITSLMSAFARAYHAENAQKAVFADTKAKELMTDEEYAMIGGYVKSGIDFFAPEKKNSFKDDGEMLEYIVNTQLAPTPVARGAYCEQCLKTAFKTGTEQYVILGAGLDTFAFREKEFIQKYKVYELDHPLTQSNKIKRIEKAGWEIPENLHFVPIDFSKDNLYERLRECGFDSSKKTFFSWLGVSFYLTKKQIESVVESISSFAAEGSTLLFDYGDERLFKSDVKRVKNMLMMASAGGEAMKAAFYYDELEELLERHGFLIYELMTAEDIQYRYFKDRNDNLSAFEHVCFAQAVYKGKK